MISTAVTNFWGTSPTSIYKPKAWIYKPDGVSDGKACLIWIGGKGEQVLGSNIAARYVPKSIVDGWKPPFSVITFEGNGSGVCQPINVGQTWVDYCSRILAYVKDVMKADPTRIYMAGLSAGGYTIMEWLAASQELCDSIAAILPASPMAGSATIGWNKLLSPVNFANVKSIGTGGTGSGDLSFLNNLKAWSNKAVSHGAFSQVREVPGAGHTSSVWSPFYAPTSDVWAWLLQQKTGPIIEPVKEIAKYEVSFLSDGSNKITKISGVDMAFTLSS